MIPPHLPPTDNAAKPLPIMPASVAPLGHHPAGPRVRRPGHADCPLTRPPPLLVRQTTARVQRLSAPCRWPHSARWRRPCALGPSAPRPASRPAQPPRDPGGHPRLPLSSSPAAARLGVLTTRTNLATLLRHEGGTVYTAAQGGRLGIGDLTSTASFGGTAWHVTTR